MKLKLNDHFFAWAFIYAIAVFLSIQSISFFNLQRSLLGIFLAGLIITLFSGIMHLFLYKNKFRLNKWFFIWLFTYPFNFWLIDLVLRKLNLNYNGFFYFLAFGVICHLFTWIIKYKIYFKIKMNNKKTIVIILIFFIALLFVSSQSFSEIQTTGLTEGNPISPILNVLKGLISFNPSSYICPQLNYSLHHSDILYSNVDVEEHNGWKISAHSMGHKVYCVKGYLEGQNPNYLYCGTKKTGLAYMEKTFLNPDGTIGKTIKQGFMNIYDENQNFIKTICGRDPDEIMEEDFKRNMKELDDLLTIE